MRDHGIVGPFCHWRCTRCGKPRGPHLVAWPASERLRWIRGPVCLDCAAYALEVLDSLGVTA